MPAEGERVVTVVGGAGSCGASTVALALALASIADAPARLVECCPPPASGLAAATTAELGANPSGWAEGTRGDVVIQRTNGSVCRPEDVPAPPPGERLELTVLALCLRSLRVLDTSPSWALR